MCVPFVFWSLLVLGHFLGFQRCQVIIFTRRWKTGIDQGFEEISISKPNYFSTPRIIASKVNEDAKLTNLPGNKSMTMRFNLGTTDSKVSPAEDYREHTFTIDELPSFKSYRIKLLLTSNNQANPPKIRNLRVIALA